MSYRHYNNAMGLAVQARALLRDLRRFRQLEDEPMNGDHPHASIVSGAVEHGLASSHLEDALVRFETAMYEALPEIRGKHDSELFSQSVESHIKIHGNDTDEAYAEARKFAEDHGIEWHSFDVGIGASGIDFVLGVGSSLAATALWEFVKMLRQRGRRPRIDLHTAIELCKYEVLTRLGSRVTIDAAYGVPPSANGAQFQVYVHTQPDDRAYVFLVRADGEICGRKEAALVNDVAG